MGKKKARTYDPTAETTYPSKKAFNRRVRRKARSQIQPQLDEIRGRKKEAVGANEARTREIGGYYDQDVAARTAGFDRLKSAMDSILGRQDVLGDTAQAGLSAALRASTDAQGQAAGQLGTSMPNMDPQLLKTLAAYSQGNQLGLAGQAQTELGRSAADIGLTGVERRSAGEMEGRRHAGVLEGLSGERKALIGQLPALRSQARSDLVAEALAQRQQGLAEDQFGETKRSNRAGEKLADRQADLAENQFGEQKRARRFDERMARKQAKINQGQLDVERQRMINDAVAAGEDPEAAKARAGQFDGAAEWLSGYLSPGEMDERMNQDGKPVFSPKKYNARINFHDALVQIMNRFGMNRGEAYRVLKTSGNREWRNRAQSSLDAWKMRTRPH